MSDFTLPTVSSSELKLMSQVKIQPQEALMVAPLEVDGALQLAQQAQLMDLDLGDDQPQLIGESTQHGRHSIDVEITEVIFKVIKFVQALFHLLLNTVNGKNGLQ